MKDKCMVFVCCFLIFFGVAWSNNGKISFDRYHPPSAIQQFLKQTAAANSGFVRLHTLAKTPGDQPYTLLEIGPEVGKKKKNLPAILVVANMEGTVPISSEAALYLMKTLVEKPELRKGKTWYVLPVGNPDSAVRYFLKPLYADRRNHRLHNDDMDDRTDEDGFDDLNGDGIITQMRAKDPQGMWMPVPGDPRMLKKADWSKGEKGIYKLYSEGTDNDGDGQYNEDGKGGVALATQFPHLFKFFKKDGGAWSGSEEEVYSLFRFVYSHPEIAITFVFGETNFCLNPPQGGRRGKADFSKIKIPKRFGRFLNVDIEKTYTMKEIMEIVQRVIPPGMDVTESMVASFFGLGAVVNPLPADLKFYKELSSKYKEFLKKNKLDGKRQKPAKAKDGSFELWSYYHLGLPSFSLDFWTLPQVKEKKKGKPELTPDQLEKMSNDEFIALGEEKINKFLKASGAPDRFNASMIINALKGGMMTTKRMAETMRNMPKPKSKEGGDPKLKALLAFDKTELKGKGFVNWKSFKHPTLGDVEIGGEVPFASDTPPASMVEALLKGQVPWIFKIVDKLPSIRITDTKIKSLGNGLYQVSAWAGNQGYLPYPTAMGRRNNRIPPVVIQIQGPGIKIVEGKKRALVKNLDGFQAKKVKWLIYKAKPGTITLTLTTPMAGGDARTLNLGGKK